MPTSDLLTNSRLRVGRACQRKHKFQFLDGFRPRREAEPLRFGTLMHAGLEAWWKCWRTPAERLVAALSAVAAEADPFDRARAEALLSGYDARWGGERYEVLAVEAPFVAPLLNPDTSASSRTWRLAGKLDAVVRDLADGRVLLVEHKTTSDDIRLGSDYWKRLRLDSQVSIYYEGARALGFAVAGCLYDVIAKPTIRPLKATPPEHQKYTKDGRLYATQRSADETSAAFRERLLADIAADPDGYFARGDVVRLEREVADALHDAWGIGRQLREAELAKRWPRNPDACVLYGRTCDFFAVCAGEQVLEEGPFWTRSNDVHPELGGAIAPAKQEEQENLWP